MTLFTETRSLTNSNYYRKWEAIMAYSLKNSKSISFCFVLHFQFQFQFRAIVTANYTIQKFLICTSDKYLHFIFNVLSVVVLVYVELMVCLIHAELGVILSYIRGRSMPFG